MNIKDIPNNSNRIYTNTGSCVPHRLVFIEDHLRLAGMSCQIDEYLPGFYNLYHITNQDSANGTILITAHWDVVKQFSDNCLDNTASIYNLFKLAQLLDNVKDTFNCKLVLAWTDAEEPCDPNINGAVAAVIKFKPNVMIDLELTASGDIIAYSAYQDSSFMLKNAFSKDESCWPIGMPYNNAMVVSMVHSVPTVCVALINEQDKSQLIKSGRCVRWDECHRPHDTFDNWFNLKHTEDFLNRLVSIVRDVDKSIHAAFST